MSTRSLSASVLALGLLLPVTFAAPSYAVPSDERCKMNEIEDAATASCIPKPGYEKSESQGLIIKQQPGNVEEPDFVGSSSKSERSYIRSN
jgi:hypothetical protein